MKKLALISGLLFLVVFFWVNSFTKDENSFEAVYPSVPVSSLSDMDNPEPPALDDMASASLQTMDDMASAYQQTRDDMASPDPVTFQASSKYIIVASFGDLEQARKTADTYTVKYQADIFILPATPDGFYRISYGRYATAEDAGEALGDVRQKGFTDAWLLDSK